MLKGIFKGVGNVGNSVLGIVKETSDPASKISSKKGAATALMSYAGYLSTLEEPDKYLITLFVISGTVLLLAVTAMENSCPILF